MPKLFFGMEYQITQHAAILQVLAYIGKKCYSFIMEHFYYALFHFRMWQAVLQYSPI